MPSRFALIAYTAALLACAPCARAADWLWRAAAGAEINPSSHGVVDFGLRRGAFSMQLLTDTLDIRYAPDTAHRRYWLGARGEALVAGLFLSPWTGGAPDPSRALTASYAGLDGGLIRYLGRFYLGAQASERVYVFSALSSTVIPVRPTTSLLTVDAVAGYYDPELQIWLRAGIDLENTLVSPHITGELTFRRTGPLAPRFELRAAWARNQTDLTRTRLGGLNPYVVPLAGAGWAEFWVQDFVAGRIGLTWMTRYSEVGPVLDAAAFDGGVATGLGLLARGHYHRFFAETMVGYAPWIPRQEGVGRFSVWIFAGTSWGSFRRSLD